MKKRTFFTGTSVLACLLVVLAACESKNQTTHSNTSPNGKNQSTEQTSSTPSNENKNESPKKQTGFSTEQIEYARVWFMLGPNKQVEELNVTVIPAGTLVNPNDETSAVYPVDITQLAGPRLVDESVTYSSNGDGTINVYNVPLRWESSVPDDLDPSYMKAYTQSLLDNAKKVSVEATTEKELTYLLNNMHIQ